MAEIIAYDTVLSILHKALLHLFIDCMKGNNCKCRLTLITHHQRSCFVDLTLHFEDRDVMISFCSGMQLLNFELLCALHILQNLSLDLIVWGEHRCKLNDLSLLRYKPLLCETDFNWVLLEDFT